MNNKQRKLISMLKEGNVLVMIDPRVEGVIVPVQCYNSIPLGLQLGYDLPVPIEDLKLTEEGFSATLSFNRTPSWVSIPWVSVFGMVDEDNHGPLWILEIPFDLVEEFPFDMAPEEDFVNPPILRPRTERDLKVINGDSQKQEERKKPLLKLVESDDSN